MKTLSAMHTWDLLVALHRPKYHPAYHLVPDRFRPPFVGLATPERYLVRASRTGHDPGPWTLESRRANPDRWKR